MVRVEFMFLTVLASVVALIHISYADIDCKAIEVIVSASGYTVTSYVPMDVCSSAYHSGDDSIGLAETSASYLYYCDENNVGNQAYYLNLNCEGTPAAVLPYESAVVASGSLTVNANCDAPACPVAKIKTWSSIDPDCSDDDDSVYTSWGELATVADACAAAGATTSSMYTCDDDGGEYRIYTGSADCTGAYIDSVYSTSLNVTCSQLGIAGSVAITVECEDVTPSPVSQSGSNGGSSNGGTDDTTSSDVGTTQSGAVDDIVASSSPQRGSVSFGFMIGLIVWLWR